MKCAILLSPLRGDLDLNRAYLRRCIRDSVLREESPYASHRMLDGPLDELKPEERKLGMLAGLAWFGAADVIAVYTDLGISDGMNQEIKWTRENFPGIPVEMRTIGKEEDQK